MYSKALTFCARLTLLHRTKEAFKGFLRDTLLCVFYANVMSSQTLDKIQSVMTAKIYWISFLNKLLISSYAVMS